MSNHQPSASSQQLSPNDQHDLALVEALASLQFARGKAPARDLRQTAQALKDFKVQDVIEAADYLDDLAVMMNQESSR